MKRTIVPVISLLGMLSIPSIAHSAYEKPSLWSAKWTSLGGASAAAASGSDALVFNPAGLAKSSKSELGINLAPTIAKFKGPNVSNNIQQEGESTFSPVGGLIYSRPLNEKISLGAGFYVAGGNSAEFEGINFESINSTFTKRGTNKTDLKLFEASLGLGYKVNNNLRLGAAWRIGKASAELFSSSATAGASGLAAHVQYTDLKDTNLAGFRLGAQYESDDSTWGLGLHYRSQVTYRLEGKGGGSLQLGTNLTAANGGTSTANLQTPNVQATSRLPMQLSLGSFKKFDKLTVHFQFDWTKYSVNEKIKFEGEAFKTSDGSATLNNNLPDLKNTPVIQDNSDMYAYKLGLDYMCDNGWNWRLGYALSTQVTPDNSAKSTLASPGNGHLLAIGAGKEINENWNIDFAIERAWRSGEVGNNLNPNSGNTTILQGEYESAGHTAHVTAKYLF